MARRYITIWFRHLTTDWLALRRPALKEEAFVLAAPDRGKLVICAANSRAQVRGVGVGMAVADARAIIPLLPVFDDRPGLAVEILKALGRWCIRYTPVTAVDAPDGLILDISGCAHLWGDERTYLKEIEVRLRTAGYDVRAAMADTIGVAWAVARFGGRGSIGASGGEVAAMVGSGGEVKSGGEVAAIVESGGQMDALISLPAAALRLEPEVIVRLRKLGLGQIGSFIGMSRSALRRRFGPGLLLRLDQALGFEEEVIEPVEAILLYQERLPCLEPIVTGVGIGIALRRLLEVLCRRLQQDGKGLRTACLKGFRVDGRVEQIGIGTNKASNNTDHLFKLFELNIQKMEPDQGIELFILEASKVEDVLPLQEKLWEGIGGLEDKAVAELLDRLAGKLGGDVIHRYLPDEHHWPERSLKRALSIDEKTASLWRADRVRPIRLLPRPEPIEVTAPIPDYPPMSFRYQGRLHKIKKADGPERIEREWWLEGGNHRDYYYVEDEEGSRYWLFRSGHYGEDVPARWFIHGFFA